MTSNTDHHTIAAAVRTGLRHALAAGITDAEQHRRRHSLTRRLITASTTNPTAMHALADDILAHAHAMPTPPAWTSLDENIISFPERLATQALTGSPSTGAEYVYALLMDLYRQPLHRDVDHHVIMICGMVELALTLRTLATLH
jgi:hypothetical protein